MAAHYTRGYLMARYGTWRPLNADTWNRQPRLATPDIISLHTMVGTLAGTDSMFRRNGYSGTFSHFGLGHDGTVYQWQDTAYRAAANLNGNHRIISVETADRGTGFPAWDVNDGNAVPAWTPAQTEALARMIAFLCRAHDIPCQLIPDSRAGRRGIGYHRQGVDGSFADHRVPDGELWSSARGKVCPGSRRIAQIPQVIARARELLPNIAQEADDMPLTNDDLAAVRDIVWRAPIDDVTQAVAPGQPLVQIAAWEHVQRANAFAFYARGEAQYAADQTDKISSRLDALEQELTALKVAGGLDPAVRYRLVAEA
jgi:hypothetical protein